LFLTRKQNKRIEGCAAVITVLLKTYWGQNEVLKEDTYKNALVINKATIKYDNLGKPCAKMARSCEKKDEELRQLKEQV
jgi:hypothetical protein